MLRCDGWRQAFVTSGCISFFSTLALRASVYGLASGYGMCATALGARSIYIVYIHICTYMSIYVECGADGCCAARRIAVLLDPVAGIYIVSAVGCKALVRTSPKIL